MDKFVSYLRVSTSKQSLGIEAQRDACASHVKRFDGRIIAEYVEVESGKNDRRPQVQNAIRHARLANATLIIARLDRLTRSIPFLVELQKSKVKFIAVDFPEANELTITILVAVASFERRMISERTKAALAAAKRRGTKLGNPNGARALRGISNAKAAAANRQRHGERREQLRHVIEPLAHLTAHEAAQRLNDHGYETPGGNAWSAAHVRRFRRIIA